MKIRTQFIISVILFAVILITLATSLIVINNRITRFTQQEELVNNIERSARELGYTAESYLLYGESQLRTRWESTFDTISTDLSTLNDIGAEEQVVVDSIKANLAGLRIIFADVAASIERNSPTPGGFFDRLFIQVSWSRLEVQSQSVVFDSLRLFRILNGLLEAERQARTTLLFVLVGIFAIYIFSNYLLIFRRTLKSLSALNEGVKVIGSGNLNYTVPEKHKDEVGDLSRAFNRMTTELKTVTASKADLEKEILERIKAEEVLDRERKQLAALIESLDEAVGVWNTDGSLVLINDATAKLYGVETKEQMLKHLSEYADVQVWTMDGRELPQEEWPPSRVLRGETFSDWELEQFVPSINKRFIGSNSGRPIRDASGKIILGVTSVLDITERKRAEEAIKESEAKANALIKYAPTGIYEIDFRTGKFLSVNDAMSAISGYTREELFALGPAALLDEESQKVFADRARRQLAGETVDPVIEYRVKKDGSVIFVNLNVAFSKVNPSTVFVIGHDITERKKAENQLRDSEGRFRALSETSPIGVGVSSADGILLYANPSYELILGYNHSELIGKKASDLYWDPEDRRSWVSQMKVIGIARSIETRLKRKDGTPVWVSINASPIIYGGTQAVMGTIQDISERKEAEEALKRYAKNLEIANKELESFSYSVSHDLRAPLRGIDGFSDALLEDYEDQIDEKGKDYLKRIRSSSQLMSQYIDGLLKLSRTARAEMHPEKVNLSGIVRSISEELKQSQSPRNAEFIISQEIVAYGDRSLLDAVLRNLLENAWKFTSKRPETRIEFGMIHQEGKPVYYVKDNGIGFDMQYSDKLFKEFTRLHNQNDYPGTGIGLANVQRIVRRHGGEIWAESKIGKGTIFYFTLNIGGPDVP